MNSCLIPTPTGLWQPGDRVLIVAELSGNHNGSLKRALDLVQAAKTAGADAIKLQTYTADTITMDAPGPWFEITSGPWAGRRLHELYQEASTPWAWHRELFDEARKLDLLCFSTPFDPTSVVFLETLRCPTYKVASFEVVDIPLLECIGATRRPVILSTGMATLSETDLAISTLRQAGCPGIVLLNCVSAYPAPPVQMHLGNLSRLASAFNVPVGLSDHSLTPTAAIASVALGGCLVEKHLCLSRSDGGPDAAFSLEPHEFESMVAMIRECEQAIRSSPSFGPTAADAGNLIFRKSLFIAHDLPAGHILGPDDIRCIRPGHGLAPALLPMVIGRRTTRAIARATPLTWDLVGAP